MAASDLYANPIFRTVSVPYRVKQTQYFKLQYKAADGSIGSIPEALFQLHAGELSFTIRGKDKIPQRFFRFYDLSLGRGGLRHIGRPHRGESAVHLIINIFGEKQGKI